MAFVQICKHININKVIKRAAKIQKSRKKICALYRFAKKERMKDRYNDGKAVTIQLIYETIVRKVRRATSSES